MRALLILTWCAALAAPLGCGKSEADPDATLGGGSSGKAGQSSDGGRAGNAASAAGSASEAGSAASSVSGAGGRSAGGAGGGAASGGAASGGAASGGAASGGAGPGQGGSDAEGGTGTGQGEGGTPGLVDCNVAHALCRSLPPECAAMHVPSIVGTCWGPCVKIDHCACSSANQCPDSNRYTCWGGEHCGPYVQ